MSGSSKPILVRTPKEMYEQIEELVKKKLYRNPADFFYVAGQKELDRAIERLRVLRRKKEVTAQC